MKLSNKEKLIVFLMMIVVLIFFGSKYISINNRAENNFTEITSNKINSNLNEELQIEENKDIYVHICGRVKNPGLIKLSSGSRVIDAVELSGGIYEDADLDRINLAKKLKDEDRIYIPVIGEEGSIVSSDKSNDGDLININTSSIDELQKLPGIGPKMAENIIEYRKNNSFDKIDDLKKVSGIGDKKYSELEKFICTN